MMKRDDEHYTRRDSIRLRTFDYAARCIYFVTIVTQDRRQVFVDNCVARAMIETLLQLRHSLKFNLYIYCLMPDHFHALVGTGESGKTLGQICGAFKSLSTRRFWQWHEGTLWQRQFFDHIIRNEEDYFETRDYIRLNPVRKGLVEDWQDWEYTGEVDRLYS